MDIITAARGNASIEWRPSTKCFHARQSRTKMRGVHQIVKSYMPRTPKEHAALLDAPNHANSGIQRGYSAPCRGAMTLDERDSRMCKGGSNPKQHGTIVDEEIGRYARVPIHDREMFVRDNPDLDRCTVTLINFFKREKLTPLETQLIVGDLKRNCATMIDLVCRDVANNTVIVEIKATKHTSHEWYEEEVGMLKAPLHNIPCSMLNVDMLQLLTTKLIVEHGNCRVKVPRAMLIRVSGNGLWSYTPPSWFTDPEVQRAYYGDVRTTAKALERARQAKQKAATERKAATAKKRQERIAKSKKPWKARQRKGEQVFFNPRIEDLL